MIFLGSNNEYGIPHQPTVPPMPETKLFDKTEMEMKMDLQDLQKNTINELLIETKELQDDLHKERKKKKKWKKKFMALLSICKSDEKFIDILSKWNLGVALDIDHSLPQVSDWVIMQDLDHLEYFGRCGFIDQIIEEGSLYKVWVFGYYDDPTRAEYVECSMDRMVPIKILDWKGDVTK